MRRCLTILALLLPMLVMSQEMTTPDTLAVPDTVRHLNAIGRIKQRINDKLNEPFDTTRDGRYWWRALKHGKVDFNDSTMDYPKFVMFCYKTYKWGDRAFNSYDSDYVVSTGKNWKLFLKSDNWVDSYVGKPFDDVKMVMNSNLVSNIGVNLSFMAVSLGYSVGVSNLIHGEKVSDKVDFSFTCARFAADAYYWENKNEITVYYTDKRIDNERHKLRQPGITRKAMGATAYYFFNNRRYAQAAAYCFSKYQKRSAGSFLAGISLQHFDVRFDVEKLSEEGQDYIPTQEDAPRILYNDYCVLFGYGYNWVLGKKWLLNFTVTPYLGYRYNLKPSSDLRQSAFSLNLRARIGAVYNHKRFFMGLQGYPDHHRYSTKSSRLINSLFDVTALFGIRF
ncbi:MAG: DUF4421 domain-containing protein [Muribaculaceae bacterium]|nr:DUF4421 domain-containing protein [Muribaculaceae bacterium]